MASEADKKRLTLRSSDSEEFEVEEVVAMESQTIRHMIQDDRADRASRSPASIRRSSSRSSSIATSTSTPPPGPLTPPPQTWRTS